MNIAFGALLLLIFLFPGIICRIGFLNGPYSRKNINSSLLDELIISILPAMLFQVIGYAALEHLLGYDVNIRMIYQIISGPSVSFKEDLNYLELESSLVSFLLYTICISVIAFLLGHLARWVVFKLHFDLKYHWFRVNNDWYYLLSAKQFNYDQKLKGEPEANMIQVDVLMEGKDADYLYSGLLERFFLSSAGLETIYLSGVYRRKLETDRRIDDIDQADKDIDERYYKMPGNVFVIPYVKIRNLNLSYYHFSQDTNPEEEENIQ